MTGQTNPRGWAKRLTTVFGAAAIVFALIATAGGTAQAVAYPQPNLAKQPRMPHIMNQDFGTAGVKASPRIKHYSVDVPGGSVYGEARVVLTVSGFEGPVTVWYRSLGSAHAKGTAQPWRKVQIRPVNGRVLVSVPVAQRHHCAMLAFRVNDGKGNWTKAFTEVRVRATETPGDTGGGSITW